MIEKESMKVVSSVIKNPHLALSVPRLSSLPDQINVKVVMPRFRAGKFTRSVRDIAKPRFAI